MDSYTIAVGKFFNDKVCLLVPLFQRPYVWKQEEQWEPLWNDISAVANRVATTSDPRPHFIGAVVLEALPRKVGRLEHRLVIDGQQRLTTLQILLRAFADVIPEQDETSQLRKDIVSLVSNTHSNVKEPWEANKVWPTNADRVAFTKVMGAGGAEALAAKHPDASAAPLPIAAYLYFHAQIRERLKLEEEGSVERIDQLQTAITQCLNIVVIDIQGQDDSQVIFETLNARGTPLLPADLIKNSLLTKARWEKADEELLYNEYWQIFDTDPYWREEVGRGHARRARIDIFLQNYLTARTLEEVPVSHLYTTFRDWVVDKKETAEWHCKDVRHYADVYRKLQQWPENCRERQFLYRLETMAIVSAGPFLLELFVRYFDTQRALVQEILGDVESFLFRRMVCGLTTRGYNRLFLELTKVVGAGGDIAASVRARLLASAAAFARWPSDEEFQTSWRDRPVGEELRAERVRIILEAVESRLRTSKTEGIIFERPLQVEHLMPQAWTTNYPIPNDAPKEFIVNRNRAVQTMGNLSLLTESLNPSVSNGPWSRKRSEILIHSALSLNRSLPESHWDEDQIRSRASFLFEAARQAWPRPANAVV